MPWKVKKAGSKWAIYRADTGKVVGHSTSKAKAQASVRARYAAEGRKGKKHKAGGQKDRKGDKEKKHKGKKKGK